MKRNETFTEAPVFTIFAQDVEPKVLLKNTFINPFNSKDVILSIFQQEKSECSGFRVVDEQCFAKLINVFETVKPENLDFEVILKHE
jgi:hypothetical protein